MVQEMASLRDQSKTWLSNCSDYENDAFHNDYRCQAIMYARTTSAALSIIGSLLVLFIIFVYRKYRLFTQRLVLYLIVPTWAVSGCVLYPFISNTTQACEVVGFFFNWGILSQRFIILCIVIHLLVFTFRQSRPKYLELMFHGLIWGVSWLLSLVPIFGHHYGSAGVWCWIKGQTAYQSELRFGTFYIWVWCCITIEVICFAAVLIRLRKQFSMFDGYDDPDMLELRRRYKHYIYPLLLYPMVNFILAIPVTINRIQNMVDPENPIFGLFLIHSIIYPIWGFFNMLMYFLNRETIQQLHPRAIMEELKYFRCRKADLLVTTSAPRLPDVNTYLQEGIILSNPTARSETMNSDSDMD